MTVLLLIVIGAGVLGSLRSTGRGGLLDPLSYRPDGTRAVATLLAQRGVPVRRVVDLDELDRALSPGSTVLVAMPELLTEDELARLAALDQSVVVVGADLAAVRALDLPAKVGPAGDIGTRTPSCSLPPAATAGSVTLGGYSYGPEPPADGVVGCYPAGRRFGLLALLGGRRVLLGAPDLLTNQRLSEQGNAALAVELLGAGPDVVWLLPDPGRPVQGERAGLASLIPRAVTLGALQLGLAVLLLALWRARRLGPVTHEPLPVVVRAAETVEGRGRLYRAAKARHRAAQVLRAAARDRLTAALGLPADAGRQALVAVVADRTGRQPFEVDALLYGADPAEDRALVRLADELDGLSLTPPAVHQPQHREEAEP